MKAKSLHYRTKLSLVLVGAVLIPAAVVVILYYLFAVRYNHEQIFKDYQSWLVECTVTMQERVDGVLGELRRFETDGTLLDYLKYPERYNMPQKIDIFGLNKEILAAVTARTDVQTARSVRVYGCRITGEMVVPGPMFPFRKLEAGQPGVAEELRTTQRGTLYRLVPENGREPAALRVYQPSRDIYGELIAVNEIEIPLSYFREEASGLPAEQGFVAYQAEGAEPALLYAGRRDPAECLAVYREFAAGGQGDRVRDYFVLTAALMFGSGSGTENDRVSFFFPQSLVYQSETEFLRNTLYIALLAAVLIVITIRAVSRALTRRLYQLLSDVSVDTEALISGQRELAVRESDEFGQIQAKFREIIARIQGYSRKAMQAEYEKKMLEAELMQDLIAPHFLYNTLDGMRWSTDDPNLIRVIDHMVNFYRIALNKGDFFVTMTQEFEMVRSYLEVQRFSYESEFRYRLEMDEALGDVRILKHIIQPIVENALVHGIDKRGDHGLIEIAAREREGLLQIEITDNGAGMTGETIAQLLEGASGLGYGVHNVIQRIGLFYGGEYGLKIQSRPNGGTTVWVTLPLQNNPPEEERGKLK